MMLNNTSHTYKIVHAVDTNKSMHDFEQHHLVDIYKIV